MRWLRGLGVGSLGVVANPRTLQTNSGRKKILSCMQQRLPLTKHPGDATIAAVGIPECQAVVDEMAAVKSGTSPGGMSPVATPNSEEAACPPSAAASDPVNEQEQGEKQLGAHELAP